MTWLENTTKKQSWAMLIVALAGWSYIGWALCQPVQTTGSRPIADVAVLVAFFGTLVAILGISAPQAYKSYQEKKIDCGAETSGEVK